MTITIMDLNNEINSPSKGHNHLRLYNGRYTFVTWNQITCRVDLSN